jgi:hypothetical protein
MKTHPVDPERYWLHRKCLLVWVRTATSNTALHGIRAYQMDEKHHLAKVMVAGSNLVFRSRQSPYEFARCRRKSTLAVLRGGRPVGGYAVGNFTAPAWASSAPRSADTM